MQTEFQGTKTLQPFSPRWTDPGLLEKTLVGRRDLVEKLEQLVLEGAGGPNKYQRLIVGPRGSGKTHVLKVLHTRLWRNAGLRDRLLIAYLLEDELGVASFLDFLVRLLKAVAAWYPVNTELAKGLEALYDLPAGLRQRRAVELLLAAAGTRDLLIIMENLGVTFDGTHGFGRKGQQALRDLVQQHPRFMIVASAQALLDGISEPNAPFYQFFAITHLKKLSLEEAMEMLAGVAEAYGDSGVTKFLGTPEGRSRVRAIYAFTGGNHRLLVTFFDFLSADSVGRVSDAFLEALKPLKPYYQEQMRALSAQQQKIVQYLSLERTPRTVKEIARGCLATSNTVSSQMKSLLEKGFVDRIQQGRESYYEISETLFRICYEADLDHQGAPVRLFIDFLGSFYTAQELEARARGFHLLARTVREEAPSHESEAALYRTALVRYHKGGLNDKSDEANVAEEWNRFFRDLSEHKAYPEIISFAKKLGDSKDAGIALVEADAYAQSGNLAEACAVVRREINRCPEDANLHAKLGSLLVSAGDSQGAEDSCRRALELEPSHESARRALVAVLYRTGRHSDALAEFQILSSGLSAMAAVDFAVLGFIHGALGRTLESVDAWRRSVELDSSNVNARLNFGLSLASVGRTEDALEQFEASVALDSTNVDAQAESGRVLANLGRLLDAEVRFRTALSLDPENRTALVGLAFLLNRTGRPQEASAVFARAMELATPSEETTLGFVRALIKQGLFIEAEPFLRDAVVKWPASTRLRSGLVEVLINTDRLGECLKYVRVNQQLEPRQAHHFLLGGLAALSNDDLDEAEKNLREAIRLDEKLTEAWRYLANVMTRTGRHPEAVEFLRTAASLSPLDADVSNELGVALKKVGELDQAETAFRQAEGILRELIKREPDNARARDDFANISIKMGQPAEALEQVLEVRKLEPGNARNFLRGGIAAWLTRDFVDAERQLRVAIEIDPRLTDAWLALGITLSVGGRRAEAIELLGHALQEADKAKILAGRGDLLAEDGNFAAAAADFEEALKLDASNPETMFKLAGVLLPQGRVGEAAEVAGRAIDLQPGDEHLVERLRSNLDALFSHCTRSQMATYLEPVLDALDRHGRLAVFEQALSVAVFGLLKEQENVSEDRFADAIWALENVVAGRVNVSEPVLFLSVGVEYFKRGESKALMKLSREERSLFVEELGIEGDEQ